MSILLCLQFEDKPSSFRFQLQNEVNTVISGWIQPHDILSSSNIEYYLDLWWHEKQQLEMVTQLGADWYDHSVYLSIMNSCSRCCSLAVTGAYCFIWHGRKSIWMLPNAPSKTHCSKEHNNCQMQWKLKSLFYFCFTVNINSEITYYLTHRLPCDFCQA